MAEKRFLKGLFKDTGHVDQPENTWRYALNAVINRIKGSISNEKGTIKAGSLEPGHVALGAIEVSDNRVVIFSKESDSTSSFKRSEIGIWDKGIYTSLYNPVVTADKPGLNFNVKYLLEGTYKINSNNDLIIYFTDDLNPPRAFNVSRQQRNLSVDSSKANLYGIDATESHEHHIDLLNLFPSSGPIPTITLSETAANPAISEGGGLSTGIYYLALAYVDEDLVATNFLSVSNPVAIVEEFNSTRPTTKVDGAKAGTQTSKAIKWLVSNTGKIDYKYIRPVVIRKMGEATDAYRLNDIEVNTVIANGVTFNGTENVSAAPIESVIVDTIGYDTAKNIVQLDDVLYLGNTTSNKDIGFQKYANNIKLTAKIKTISEFDTFIASVDNFETGFGTTPVDSYGASSTVENIDADKSYRSDKLSYQYKGYMRDEVYAFYIAFILHDGSMSYAYHIPGRKSADNSSELTLLSDLSDSNPHSNLKHLSPYAKKFHVVDSTSINNKYMNYWENTNEVYPSNSNFDVWDETSLDTNEAIDSLKGEKVRHHHFPSNSVAKFSSVSQVEYVADNPTQDSSIIETALSAGTSQIGADYTGTFKVYRLGNSNPGGPKWPGNSANGGITENGSTWSVPCTFDAAVHSSSEISDDEAFGAFCPNGDRIVIPGPMTISSLSYRTYAYRSDGGGNMCDSTRSRLIIIKDNVQYYAAANYEGNSFGYGNDGPKQHGTETTTLMYPEINAPGGTSPEGEGIPISLNAGDQIYLQGRGGWAADQNGSRKVTFANSVNINSGTVNAGKTNTHFIELTIASQSISADEYDAKIKHEVNILGFDLSDVKIPKSLKDQVQGFRIYRAKRTHENKTILGQAPILPMSKKANVIGMCSESNGAPEAMQILGTLQNSPEIFYNKDPWPLISTDTGYEAGFYRNFSFPDFNLLRSKNSLSPATHITPQYRVGNLVWNGPTVHQDKKMVTRLENFDSDTEPINIREDWGYDANFNCYPSLINSAIFIGGIYARVTDGIDQTLSFANGAYSKMLGQKAKTYLLGDSIFSGHSLGFGGKVFNEFGESTAIFGLRDGNLLKALDNKPDADPAGLSSLDYGSAHEGMASLLVNPDLSTTNTTDRSNIFIANLDAFKTDVYKSIDAQTLVYTGYEVVGSDLDKFVFDDRPKSPSYLEPILGWGGAGANSFNTKAIYPAGIFGGDTFISRYGFVSSLTPSNPEDLSNPKRAVHYHIVETPDNISLRHAEDDDSLYFPGAPAKQLIKYAGKDFSHVDNLRYNDNYSASNDIRPAFPLPIRNINQTDFSTRAHRSTKADAGSFIDNYRIFLASQFKDLPKNRGELWKLASFNNLLYFHMENSLFAAKGKQSMQMNDGSEAFVGSGDIFQQDPDEIVQTATGYGGTQSQWASLTTRYGYFFVDLRSKKIFLMSDKLTEISLLGMEEWFRTNLKFSLQEYGLLPADNPIYCNGLHSVWDPKHRKIVLTLRDSIPTRRFKEGWGIGLVNQNYTGAIYYNKLLNEFVENITGTEAPASDMYSAMLMYGGMVNSTIGIPLWNLDELTQNNPSGSDMLNWSAAPSGAYISTPFFITDQYLGYTSANTIFRFTGTISDNYVTPAMLTAAGVTSLFEYIPIWIEAQLLAGNMSLETNIGIAALSSDAAPTTFNGNIGDLVAEGIVVHIDEADGYAYVVPTTAVVYGDHTSPKPSVEFGCHGVDLADNPDQGFNEWDWGGGQGNTTLLQNNCQVGLYNSGVSHASIFFNTISLIEDYVNPNASSYPAKTASNIASEYTVTIGNETFNDWYLPNRKELKEAVNVLQTYHENANTSPFPAPPFGLAGAQYDPNGLSYGRFWSSSPDPISGTNFNSRALTFGHSVNLANNTPTWGATFHSPRLAPLSVLPIRKRAYDNSPIEPAALKTKVVNCDDKEYFSKGGWTVSYYPENNSWGSFHSYVPYLYFNTSAEFYSLSDRVTSTEDDATNSLFIGGNYESLGSEFVDKYIWQHSVGRYGSFYDGGLVTIPVGHETFEFDFTNIDPFEIEFIDNETKDINLTFSSVNYAADVRINDTKNLEHSGFTSAFLYNSVQMSEELKFEYLVNIRKTRNSWRFNKFRDMSTLQTVSTEYYTPEALNVVGLVSDGTILPDHDNMFLVNGMYEIQNVKYLNLEKLWNLQKKFVDKWLGIRLICSNSENYSVNLYASATEKRKDFR